MDRTMKFANYVYQSEISMLLVKYFTHQEASPKGEEELLSHQLPPPAHPIQPLPSRPPPPYIPSPSLPFALLFTRFFLHSFHPLASQANHCFPHQLTWFSASNPCHLRKTRNSHKLIYYVKPPFSQFFKYGHKSAEPLNRQKCDSERI